MLVTWPQGTQDCTHVGGRQASQVFPGQQKLRKALSVPEKVNLRQSLGVYSVLIKHSSLWTLDPGVSEALSFGPTPERGVGCLPAKHLLTHPPTHLKHFCFYLVIRKGRSRQTSTTCWHSPSENETLPPACQLHGPETSAEVTWTE